MRRPKKKKGSLLIEAMLSVMILSVSLSVIIQAMTSSYRALQYSGQYLLSLNVIENELFTLLMKRTSPQQLEEKREEEFFGRIYTITLGASDEDESDSLTRIKIKTEWNSGRKKNNIFYDTYLFKEEAGSGE